MHVFRSTYSGSFVFSTLKPNSSIMIREWHSKSLIKNTRDHFPASVFKIKNPQTTQEYGYTVHFINLWLGTQA